MMTDDPKYRYDEMDGFEPVELNTSTHAPSNEIWLSMIKSHIGITKEAQKTLFQRKYVRMLYNKEKNLLLAVSVPDAGKDTLKVCSSAHTNGVNSLELRKLLEQELRYDLSIVRIKIPGKKSSARPNAIIFDLNKAIASKPVKREKK